MIKLHPEFVKGEQDPEKQYVNKYEIFFSRIDYL